jgi:hypothetical protein
MFQPLVQQFGHPTGLAGSLVGQLMAFLQQKYRPMKPMSTVAVIGRKG